MRHWQPIHHARWRDFVAGLAAALSGRPVATVAPAAPVTSAPQPAPAPALPPEPVSAPVSAPVVETVPASVPAPVVTIPDAPVTIPVAVVEPEPPARLEPPAPPAPVFVEPVREEPRVAVVPAAPPPAPPPAPPAVATPVASRQPAPPPAEAPVLNFTSRAFFAALAWSGQQVRNATPRLDTSSEPVALATAAAPAAFSPESVPATQQTASTSAAFFGALPWSGANALGNIIKSIRVTASRDDAGLDPRSAPLPGDNPLLTGMLSAARTSDRLAARPPAPSRASDYFHAIPWSR